MKERMEVELGVEYRGFHTALLSILHSPQPTILFPVKKRNIHRLENEVNLSQFHAWFMSASGMFAKVYPGTTVGGKGAWGLEEVGGKQKTIPFCFM